MRSSRRGIPKAAQPSISADGPTTLTAVSCNEKSGRGGDKRPRSRCRTSEGRSVPSPLPKILHAGGAVEKVQRRLAAIVARRNCGPVLGASAVVQDVAFMGPARRVVGRIVGGSRPHKLARLRSSEDEIGLGEVD